MDAFSIAVSVGLQYGVPLEDYASKFINMKFEPSGMTNDADIRFASSIVDYVFRRLALDHLPPEKREGARHPVDRGAEDRGRREVGGARGRASETTRREEAPIAPPRARSSSRSSWAPAHREGAGRPLCYQCGSKMQPAGSCYVCGTCGSTSGCS